jgi:AcrR family transcriptional regulator
VAHVNIVYFTDFGRHVNIIYMNNLSSPQKIDHVKTYHHGNLRAALIAFAEQAVRSGGAATFSLRDAAKHAGVTPGAVYKHFTSKSALLGGLAASGFVRLGRYVAVAQSAANDDQRLAAIGLAYVAFAADEPHLFSLMFGPSGIDAPRDSIEAPKDGAFDALRSAIAHRQGITPENVSPENLALAWATAHGAARLVTDGLWARNDPRITMAIQAAAAALT